MSPDKQTILQGAKDAFGAPAAVLFAGMLGFGAMGQANQLDIWLTSATSFFMFALPWLCTGIPLGVAGCILDVS